MGIKEALDAIDSLKPGESFTYTNLAKIHKCSRSTLSRKHRGLSASREAEAEDQLLLSPQHEAEVVEYIRGLTERHLMPTRHIIINIVTPLCAWPPSDRWVTRFLHRHRDILTTSWTTPMEQLRHNAENRGRYCQYFDLLHGKMEEHDVEVENTYNMDEKGFMTGVIGRSVRIFDKRLHKLRQYRQSAHSGERKWVTVLGAICADGSTLPPAVIFPSPNNEVQQAWVRDSKASKHSMHFSTSANGWTNNDLGLAWLRQVFDPYTKVKAHGKKRLLLVDGHSSHVSTPFIDYAHDNNIWVCVFPPHATHTLQPLDVCCYKTLAQSYSDELIHRNHTTFGWCPTDQSDFFSIFWAAWERTFTGELVRRAFECTGIQPPNADVILDRFKTPPPESPPTTPKQLELELLPYSNSLVCFL